MNSRGFGEKVRGFYKQLAIPGKLPAGIKVMNPHSEPEVERHVNAFLNKYFADEEPRVLVFGINPGRFGAGITGITFTDPVALTDDLGIPNNLGRKRELSCEFVYKFIGERGGPKKFYRDFFLTALSPLGFVKNGKNYNYYDSPALLKAVTPFIADSVKRQIEMGGRADAAIILGTGKNREFFEELNKKHKFFRTLLAVEHPRFIMQYRRKQIPEYLKRYHEVFDQVLI